MSNVFPVSSRVNQSRDIRSVLRSRCRLFGRYGKLIFKQNQYQHARLGIIVSKKAARSSVARSRVKRVARETFRVTQEILPHVDLIFIASPGIGQVSKQELRECLKNMLSRLRKQSLGA